MRGTIFFFSFIAACALAVGFPADSATRQQKSDGTVAGTAGAARRGGLDQSKPDPKSIPRTEANSYVDGLAEAPPGHSINEVEGLERDCLGEINHLRVAHGLGLMTSDQDLLVVARRYSRQMAEQGFFSHVDPQGLDVRQRLQKAHISWSMVGENLSYSNGWVNPVATSVSGWMNSPSHRRNILEGRFNDSAIGVWIADDGTVYFTEIFVRK